MKAEAFRRLQRLFEEALQQPREGRHRWVDAACSDDTGLRADLLRLLRIECGGADGLEEQLVTRLGAAARAVTERGWAAGARVGRYRIVREIGRGGMGRVYAAVCADGGIERKVAIKVLHRLAWCEGLARRFFRERCLLAALRHPGIASLLDAGESPDGEPYLVMDLVDGEPITRYAQRERLGLHARLRLFCQVLQAVAHAHRNLILHRDLKPGNVLVDGEGRAHLIDFGIAKMIGAEDDLTLLHGRMLTPAYAAPEQLDAGTEGGVASEVYSLGVLLYELLTGRPPFQREGIGSGEFEHRIRELRPLPLARALAALDDPAERLGIPDPLAWARSLAGDIESVVQKSLRKKPDDRYASVEAFEADVRAILEGRLVGVRAGGARRRLEDFVARNRVAVASGPVAAAAAVLAMGLFLHQAAELRGYRDVAGEMVDELPECRL